MKPVLILAAAALLSACQQSPLQSQSEAEPAADTLKAAYEDAFMMGVAVNSGIAAGEDPQAQAIVLEHFNTVTLENAMKAEEINPEPGVYRFGPADRFVEFGRENDLFTVGHTLVWHNQTPAWFFQN